MNSLQLHRIANRMNAGLQLLENAHSAAIEYNEFAEHEFNDEWDLPRSVDIEELLVTERLVKTKMNKWRTLSAALS